MVGAICNVAVEEVSGTGIQQTAQKDPRECQQMGKVSRSMLKINKVTHLQSSIHLKTHYISFYRGSVDASHEGILNLPKI